MPVEQGLYYYEFEDVEVSGPPVVLIHGAGGMHLYWPPEVRRMKGCHIYALDLPGHGRSDQVGGMQQIGAYVDAVSQWMRAMDLPAALVVGHSMGGAVAMTLAYENPEQVSALGLVSTAARLTVNPILLADAANAATFARATSTIVQWSFSQATSPRTVEMAQARLNEARPSVLFGDLQACDQFDACDMLKETTCPALIVCGAEDRMTPPRQSQYLAAAIPNARLEMIPDAGHMVMLEQPAAFASVLRSFARSLVLFPGEE